MTIWELAGLVFNLQSVPTGRLGPGPVPEAGRPFRQGQPGQILGPPAARPRGRLAPVGPPDSPLRRLRTGCSAGLGPHLGQLRRQRG